MKLLTKLNIRYISYSLAVMAVSGIAIFLLISMFVNKQLDEKLVGISERVEQKLLDNGKVDWLKPFVDVTETYSPALPKQVSDTLILNKSENELEEYRQLTVVKRINQHTYKIVVRESKLESEDLIQTLAGITLFAILILTTSLILINRNVARSIWSPFNENLRKIEAFKLSEYRPIVFQKTGITEFDALNDSVDHLTNRIIADFKNLKQFSEDASHEMQTPLAVISAKLENLLNEQQLNEHQLKTVQSAHLAVQRLSKLNRELILLTKIENNQFVELEKIYPGKIIREKLNEFQELLNLKGLTVEDHLSEDVQIESNPVLFNLLLGNILSNAMNHNISGGTIYVAQNIERIDFRNTGPEEIANPERLFSRFYKENPSSGSVGLGLAIVAKICEVQGWKVSYSYAKPLHCFSVLFKI